ncbi:hypothetical protein NDU88_006637, partial [Pleurodeles waltl]
PVCLLKDTKCNQSSFHLSLFKQSLSSFAHVKVHLVTHTSCSLEQWALFFHNNFTGQSMDRPTLHNKTEGTDVPCKYQKSTVYTLH